MGSFTQRGVLQESVGYGSESPPERWQESGAFARQLGARSGSVQDSQEAAEERLTLLARAIEYEIIPRLMLAHRERHDCLTLPAITTERVNEEDVKAFAKLVLFQDDVVAQASVDAMRTRGISVETIFLDLLAPVARYLGELWEQDLCDFSEVTIGLGRLQQVLRATSAGTGQSMDAPLNGRRLLLLPCPGEQHTFGIAMVAEFFHRAGWDVAGGLSDLKIDPANMVKREWFDVVGFSLGGETHLGILSECIRTVRKASQNVNVGIIVGGPIFAANPGYAALIQADLVAPGGREAPALAEKLVARLSLRT